MVSCTFLLLQVKFALVQLISEFASKKHKTTPAPIFWVPVGSDPDRVSSVDASYRCHCLTDFSFIKESEMRESYVCCVCIGGRDGGEKQLARATDLSKFHPHALQEIRLHILSLCVSTT